jgi:2-polyprenyl-6-methoxyphenol hydroxylase-like FAD-dependent oxidoreductase
MSASGPSILVVGAGPTGLTAAVELVRLGTKPRIIDRKDGPTLLSKAVGISPHSLDVLEASGVAERLLAKGLRVRGAHFRYDGEELATIDFSRVPHRFNFLLALPQSETEAVMADVLAETGVEVEWNTTLVGLVEKDGRVEVSIEGAAGLEDAGFDFVFGADGVHSAVRDSLGILFAGHTHQRLWSIADVELADWPYELDAAHLFFRDKGNVGFIIPIAKDRFRAISNTDDALSNIPGGYRVVRSLRRDVFHIPVRQAASYQKGRVFLGGDAAHVHSPVGARGMNLGIEDASVFARRFARGGLDGYTAERWPVGHRWIKLSERILAAAQATSPLAVAARNMAFRLIGHSPFLQRPFLERMAGLKE